MQTSDTYKMWIKTGNPHRKCNTKFKIKETNVKLLEKGLSLNISSKITTRVVFILKLSWLFEMPFQAFFIVPAPRRLLACASDSKMSELTWGEEWKQGKMCLSERKLIKLLLGRCPKTRSLLPTGNYILLINQFFFKSQKRNVISVVFLSSR